MKRKLERLNERKTKLEAEADKISGFILREVPLGSLGDLENWIEEEEKRLQRTKDLIEDTQEQWLKSLQERYIALQQKAEDINFDIGEPPSAGWNQMGVWLDRVEDELHDYEKRKNKESQETLREQKEIQQKLHDLEVFAQECGVTLNKPPFSIEELKNWIPLERERVEREFQEEKNENIREQEQRKRKREEKKKKQAKNKTKKEREKILAEVAELKEEADLCEDFELREQPNILKEAKIWLAEERIRLERYRIQRQKEEKDKKIIQTEYDELRKRVKGSRFSLQKLPSCSFEDQEQWIRNQHQRFDIFLEEELKMSQNPVNPSQIKTFAVHIGRPDYMHGATEVINSEWKTSGRRGDGDSRATEIEGFVGLHEYLQEGWQIVSAVPLTGSFVTKSPRLPEPYVLTYTYRIMYTLVKY